MQVVETAHHEITTSEWEAPRYACCGPCKKVWWRREITPPPLPEIPVCPQCRGSLKAAIEGIDYTVLSNQPGRLRIGNATVGSMSMVKPEFIEKAKREWTQNT